MGSAISISRSERTELAEDDESGYHGSRRSSPDSWPNGSSASGGKQATDKPCGLMCRKISRPVRSSKSFSIGPGSDAGVAKMRMGRGKSELRVQYAAQTRGAPGKDQDRYALHVPSGGKNGLALGIFDGHSVHGVRSGREHAASVATQLPAALLHVVTRMGDAGISTRPLTSHPGCVSSQRSLIGDDEPVLKAFDAEFSTLQASLEERYHTEVAERILAEKAKLEAEIGEEMSFELPQEGGTTATAMVIHPCGLFTAWVGDSRAVVGLYVPEAISEGCGGRMPKSSVRAMPLTQDHNLRDGRERERLLACGGQIGVGDMANTHVFVKGAEGTLRITRSIGDSPFHKAKAVSSAPDVTFHPLTTNVAFVVIASDGMCDATCQMRIAASLEHYV
eukprot:scaffold265575_cov30-Tisochrysis_lutea.AAC.3